jgi:hypothetical protein
MEDTSMFSARVDDHYGSSRRLLRSRLKQCFVHRLRLASSSSTTSSSTTGVTYEVRCSSGMGHRCPVVITVVLAFASFDDLVGATNRSYWKSLYEACADAARLSSSRGHQLELSAVHVVARYARGGPLPPHTQRPPPAVSATKSTSTTGGCFNVQHLLNEMPIGGCKERTASGGQKDNGGGVVKVAIEERDENCTVLRLATTPPHVRATVHRLLLDPLGWRVMANKMK